LPVYSTVSFLKLALLKKEELAMKRQSDSTDLNRRAVLMAGLAGASALVFGSNSNLFAAEDKGVERKTEKPVDSMIPGFPKVGLREITLQPGASTKATMKNPMICECSQGSLEVVQDGKKFTANKGHVWTCKEGLVEETSNKEKTAATMRIFDLLPA
jgi:hypothetical protein